MKKGNHNAFQADKKYMLKNPPKGVKSGSWVERTTTCGNYTVTNGRRYQVRNYFRYLNHYGAPGDRYCLWDEFITLKNNDGWTIKMNLVGFTPCEAPVSKIQKLENRVKELEALYKLKNGQKP